MSHKGFVAAIFRVPGRRGGFKAPRSLSTRLAIPAATSSSNLRSYFRSWGRTFTKYLTSEQGIPRVVFTHQLKSSLRPFRARTISSTAESAESGSPYGVDSGPATPVISDTVKAAGKLKKPKKVTIKTLQSKYRNGQKLTMLTAYDYPSARVTAKAGVDMLLVGDSLGMVVLGRDGTTDVTMEEMVHHARAAVCGAGPTGPWVIGDMPFGSYLTVDDAVHNAARFVKETGVDAVKLEGGRRIANHVKAIVDCGMSVVGHIGLTPQSQAALGGFTVQGRSVKDALDLLEDALVLQEAGACMLVMEMVPRQLAAFITQRLSIPTIGIGSGAGTSGQVLVHHDVLGVYDKFKPKFSKEFANVGPVMEAALTQYREQVEAGAFPTVDHAWSMSEENLAEFLQRAHPHPSAFNIARQSNPRRISTLQTREPVLRQQVCHQTSEPYIKALTHAVVVGGGSMGSLLASTLSRTATVSVITNWEEQREAMRKKGIQVSGLRSWHSPLLPTHTDAVHVSLPHDTNQPVVVFIAVKGAEASRRAAEQAKAVLDRSPAGGFAVTVQNGIGHVAVLEEVLGKDRVLAAVTYLGARTDGPGSLVFTGEGNTVLLPDTPAKQNLAVAVRDLFRANQLQCDVQLSASHADNPLVWEKLMVNACVNPLTALVQIHNGGLAELSATTPIMVQVATEAIAVGQAAGILGPDVSPNAVVSKAQMVLQQTSANLTSMLMDVRHGRQSEIETINGHVSRLGRKLGVSTPVNDTLSGLVRAIDEKNAVSTLSPTQRQQRQEQQQQQPPQLIETIEAMRTLRGEWHGSRVGFVPTMGALHEGHLALVRESLRHNDRTVVSIFVNPMQFAPHEDFGKYPRTFAADMEKLTALGVDAVFMPTREVLYPHGADKQGSQASNTVITVTNIEGNVSEALSRPGFFQGVATVVAKLLHIVMPTRAYFGQKDATQCAVIKQMVTDLNIPTEVVIGSTLRESDGLAMSSRNAYLTQQEREVAPMVYQSLLAVRKAYRDDGVRDTEELRRICYDALQHPLIQEVQYCSFAFFASAEEVTATLPDPAAAEPSVDAPQQLTAAVALRMRDSGCRLIDNLLL